MTRSVPVPRSPTYRGSTVLYHDELICIFHQGRTHCNTVRSDFSMVQGDTTGSIILYNGCFLNSKCCLLHSEWCNAPQNKLTGNYLIMFIN